MLITKVDFVYSNWIYNRVNNNGRAFGMDILEAKENTTNYAAYTDAYPAGATEWTAYSNHEITDITRDATTGAVSFKYRGGVPTAVEEVTSEDGKPRKIMRNGQIYLMYKGQMYDLMGRRIATL